MAGDNLKAIFWNSNSWDLSKAYSVADLASLEEADVIMIRDARIDKHRETSAVDSFARTLQKITDKTWKGIVSPKHPDHRIGGDLIIYSNRIDRPRVSHVIPFGVLSLLSCKWGHNDVNLLSVYRPPISELPGSLRVLTTEKINGDLEECIWNSIDSRMEEGPIYLCGDFNLPPTTWTHCSKTGTS